MNLGCFRSYRERWAKPCLCGWPGVLLAYSGSKPPDPEALRLSPSIFYTKSFFLRVEDLMVLQHSYTLMWSCAAGSILWLTCIFQGIKSLGFNTSKMFVMSITYSCSHSGKFQSVLKARKQFIFQLFQVLLKKPIRERFLWIWSSLELLLSLFWIMSYMIVSIIYYKAMVKKC